MKEPSLYNTMSRTKEPFKPLDSKEVKLYACGPTVYNYAHIGNLRTYIFEDFLRRTLEFNDYKVSHVMNITDVGHLTSDADDGEDKMAKGAKREKKTPWEIAKFYEKAFLDDMDQLNLLEPHKKPKATDHIQEMIDQIKQLEENGLTYVGKNGNVYYDTSKFSDYGEMAQLDKQELRAGERVKVDENKKHPSDFVLWFVDSKHGDQEMQWDSPWGKGFPGWHIECSAMSMKYLGNQMDIHCGGIDHVPVHHTNEIAQAEGATGVKPWVQCWMHGNFLVVKDKEKMSKSSDNFLRIQTLIDKGYDPLDYRYFCMQSHYRKELTFSWEGMDAAKTGLRRLREKVCRLQSDSKADPETTPQLETFTSAINDDLNMPEALAETWKLLDNADISDVEKLAIILEFDKVLGLKLDKQKDVCVPENIQALIDQRNKAREEKDFDKSDQLRDEIEKEGFIVKDGAGGAEVMEK